VSQDLSSGSDDERQAEPAANAALATNLSPSRAGRMPPGEIARRSFTTTRRGFDPEEVRRFLEHVAQQLESAERREQELLHELTDAEDRARHPVIDEGVLTSALGQRSAAILRNAHEEAARIVQKAEETSASLLREAQQHATDAQVNAESSAAERIAEAELEANALRQQVREESASVVEVARAEGDVLIERAREHGRAMLEQAQEARRRVLTDMAQRRRMVTDQIEQFRAARDEIAGSVVGVRRSIDRIVEDLSRADDAARAAASEAARPARVDASDTVLVEEAERAAAEVGADSGAALSQLARDGEVLLHTPLPDAARRASTHREDDEGGSSLGTPEDLAPEVAAAGTDAGLGTTNTPPRGSPRVALRFDDFATGAAPTAAPGAREGGGGAGPFDAGEADLADADDASVRVIAKDPSRADDADPAAGSAPATDVDDLFARLRARGDLDTNAGEPVASSSAMADGGATPEPAATEPPPEDEPGPAPRSPEDEAVAERTSAIDPLVTTLSRKLKRALQDDQNRILDRLRQGSGEWNDDLLADELAQRQLYAKAASAPVRDCVAAGIVFGRSHVGGRQGRAPAPDPRTVEEVTEDLSASVVALLRRRLEGGDIPDAAERIGAAYREWRGERIERLAQDAAVDAFDAGVLSGAAKGSAVRWVRSDGGPGCADCEDNALAGSVRPGEAFPTGHVHPPAHAGCRCLLLPTPT